ncbi:NAD(P)H-hydrate epimerase [Siminovitchia acidinfaciens]|uniref:NAD(P)H-hydrate epimerase n=1 Tax=Siminovitchia acidinfaciens TaxID=2321395 RepID=A0A429XX32_9BACI|nr:NAD(P)H-hydrate epimerase [Siminovitchia acidinfaciens]
MTMFAAGRKEMQLMDQYTMDVIGLPGVVLMENAGTKIAEEVIASSPCENPRIIVLAGAGNNGGDGFVIARKLYDSGYDCVVCFIADPNKMKGDAKVHFDVYNKRGLPIWYFHNNSSRKLHNLLSEADIIVDAMLGTGVNGPLREPVSEIISFVNRLKSKIIMSVDIPSGLNSDTGKAVGMAVKASKTVSFVYPKKGFFLLDGPKYIGEWKAVDISVPTSIVENLDLQMPKVITEPLVKDVIPKRPIDGHKGTFGHVLVLGGSRPYVGAPLFTAKSSLLSGAGLVTLAVPESIYPMAASQMPQALFFPLPEKNGQFSEHSLDEI